MGLTEKERKSYFFGLMVAIIIIVGMIVKITISLNTTYLKKSKTSEASLNLRNIFDGEMNYCKEYFDKAKGEKDKTQFRFIPAPQTPEGMPQKEPRTVNWDTPSWKALKFAPEKPVIYVYKVETSGIGEDSTFSAFAYGDLDGDGSTSLFMRTGKWPCDNAGGVIYSLDETE